MSFPVADGIDGRSRTRGVLDSFIQRAVLFSTLYLLIGNVFQQAYLRTLGLRVGLIDSNHLLPAFSDIYLLAYVTLIWAVATRLPDRWYNHVAEMANLSTWRSGRDVRARLLGVAVLYGVFWITNSIEIYTSPVVPISDLEWWLPSTAFFSRLETAAVFILVGLVIIAVHILYTRVRGVGLLEVEKLRRDFLWNALQSGLLFSLMYSITFFGMIVPGTYGVWKANVDRERMFGSPVQRVTRLSGTGALCLQPSLETVSETTAAVYTFSGSLPEAHYLGQFGSQRLFLVFMDRINSHICLLNDSAIEFAEVADTR